MKLALCVAVLAVAFVAEPALANDGAKSVVITVTKSDAVAPAPAPVLAPEPEPAPCKQVCAKKCSLTLEESTVKVPVVTKSCTDVTKTDVKKSCTKQCNFVKPEAPAPAPAMPNPSAPPAAAAADEGKGVFITISKGKGNRRLQGLPLLAKLALAGKGKAGQLVCSDVCTDVPVSWVETECQDVTTEVDKVIKTPKQVCEDVCKCLGFPFTLLGKGKGL